MSQTVSAGDVRAPLQSLGHDTTRVADYDHGAGLAHALAAGFPDLVRRLAPLEYPLPGFGDYEELMAPVPGWPTWHLDALTRLDLAETFVRGREKELVSWLISTEAHCPARVRPADVKSYLRAIRRPGGLRASIACYAAVFDDAEHNRKVAENVEPAFLPGAWPLAHRRGSDYPHARSDRLLR